MTLEALYKKYLECNAVSTDTRNISKNSLFFALKGPRFNGNKFAFQALQNGAKYAVVDEAAFAKHPNIILVNNTLKTLQNLATLHRKTLGLPIIALTGSNGKTTTKELINAVLSKRFKTCATQGNLNNHIGVPLTLFSMTHTTQIGIVEMGANHLNEINQLCHIALPDYGLITNFGKAHLEGFGGFKGVIKGKSELYNYLKLQQKTIFINDLDPLQIKQIKDYKPIVRISRDLSQIDTPPYVSVNFKNTKVTSNLIGNYNFNNIAFAIAIGHFFKIPSRDIANAIEQYIPENNRSQIIKKDDYTILLDAYNANPTSMIAALNNFKTLPTPKNKILVLGDMLELGEEAEIEHQKIVSFIQNEFSNLDKVYLIGNHFSNTTTTALNLIKFYTFDDFKAVFLETKINNTFILVKGSRSMALERILNFLP